MAAPRQHELTVATDGQGLYEFTDAAARFVAEGAGRPGLLTCFLRHTSASLIIQENADPDVQRDLHGFFTRLVPEGMDWLSHVTEGPDDMPAHIKAALTGTTLSVPVADGRLLLGTWQGLYLFEHRHAPHRRRILLHLAD